MGILEAGTILEWENNQEARQFVREKGIEQFIHLYKLHKNRNDSAFSLKWGEEIEFNILDFDDENYTVSIYNDSEAVHEKLLKQESTISTFNNCVDQAEWHFEYGAYMIESTPGSPYNLSLNSIPFLQKSLIYRRWKLENILPPSVYGTTMTVFPALGTKHYTEYDDATPIQNRAARSVFLEDKIITNHSRFKYLTQNIFKRRGAKVTMLAPIFQDKYTGESPIWKNSVEKYSINRFQLQNMSELNPNPIKDHIYMDGMGFGMGMSCAQCTYMFSTVQDARYIYDQFAVLTPLWLAMTASTPFYRGMLAATDTRWDILSQSVDCRTEEEMKSIPKSRYASVSLYISDESPLVDNLEEYNDLDVPINEDAYNKIIEAGLDPIIAKHVAYLFIRYPFVVFKESLVEGSSFYNSHFENIQSTNWNSVRFKVPTSFTNSESSIGWRVEFRTPELQLSDFENAAFISFITILVKVILKEKLDMYIPISKNDENFTASAQQNAVINQKFWFRNDINCGTTDRSYKLMSLEEIMLSKDFEGNPTGLIPRCQAFVENEYTIGNCSREAKDTIMQYLQFITLRVTGQVYTNATFFRKLIASHPDYKHDSIIPPVVSYDICSLASRVGSLSMQIPELYGPFVNLFKPGFESYPSCNSKELYSPPSSVTLSTQVSLESTSTILPENSVQRYLFSICHKTPNCHKHLPTLLPKKLESNFARITSFSLKHSSSGELIQSIANAQKKNKDEIILNDNIKITDLSDYVINEDFTKSWMMRRWLASSLDTLTDYTYEDDSVDSYSDLNNQLIKLSSEDQDYFQVVHELSA